MDQSVNITPEILEKKFNDLYKIKTIDIIQNIKESLSDILQEKINVNAAEDYEILLRKHEAAIRQHISIENQLKLYYEKLEEEIDLLEKKNKILAKNLEKQKNEINLFIDQKNEFKKVKKNFIKKIKNKEKEIMYLNQLLKLNKNFSFKSNNSVYSEDISKEGVKEKDIFTYFDNYFNGKRKKKSNNSLRLKNKNNTSLSLIERKYISKYYTNKNKKNLISKKIFNNNSRNKNEDNINNYNNSKMKINENKYKTMTNISSNKLKKINKSKNYNSRFAKNIFEKIGKKISEKYYNNSTKNKVMINLNTNIINTNLNIDKLNIDSKNKLNEYQKLINDKISEITRNNRDNKLKRTLSSLFEIIDDNNYIKKKKYIPNDIKKHKNKNYSMSSSNIIIKNKQNINNLNKIQNYKNNNLKCNLRQNKSVKALLKKTNSMILNNISNKSIYYSNNNASVKNQNIKINQRTFKNGNAKNGGSSLKKIKSINKDKKSFLSLRKNIYTKITVNSIGMNSKV